MQRSERDTTQRPKLETAAQVEMTNLAHRIRRLCPDHRDPHRFHEEKSDIAHELFKLARRVV